MDLDNIANLVQLPTIQDRINQACDKLFHVGKDGIRRPYVCTFCDEFIVRQDDLQWYFLDKFKLKRHNVSWEYVLKDDERIVPLETAYCFNDTDKLLKPTEVYLIQGVALSPRGILGKTSKHHRAKVGFSSCGFCSQALDNNDTPLYSIVNKNYAGFAPKCLTDLTEVELALVSPVQAYGYCITFSGGVKKNLKGTMTFMRVEERAIARAVCHLEGMGLLNHVVILLSGHMTKEQLDRVKRKKTIRTDKMIEAVKWLHANNPYFKNINLDAYREQLANSVPIVVDKSSEVKGENTNIEEKELFSCYFPDGYTSAETGGFDSREKFLQYVEELQRKKFDVSLKLNLEKEYFKHQDGDLYTKACLLQFPYGIGGTHERRRTKDGKYVDTLDKRGSYLKHLTKKADPTFQTPMFLLILYSQISTHRLLKRARLQTRGEYNIHNLVYGLNYTDLSAAVRGRRAGNRQAGTNASKTLLNSVQACCRALPHTNEASRKARSTGEAMQHHFSIGSIFLTVTFDDHNSLLMLVMANKEYDVDVDPTTMTDDELAERAAFRHNICLDYPGLGSLNFEKLLFVLTQEVIGWDTKSHKPTVEDGLFGKVSAFAMAIEEQGRKTLHAHMTIWVEGIRELQKKMFFGTFTERELAQGTLATYFDRLVTTAFFPRSTNMLRRAFDHNCTVERARRSLPIVVDDQGLRMLRHKKAYAFCKGEVASCHHCSNSFTYDQLVNGCVRNIGNYYEDGSLDDGEIPEARLFEHIMQFQGQTEAHVDDCPTMAINALHQVHSPKHRPSCFKCNKLPKAKKKKHKCTSQCECRYRIPDRARPSAILQEVAKKTTWYEWNGTERDQPIVEVLPKRSPYDVCQNVSCKAISESKFSCNSNMSIITDGPLGQYKYKYQHKETQAEDTAEYAKVEHQIKSMTGRVHEDDRREAFRRIASAAFTHNKDNIVGAQLAAYLTRHGSRFYFSHTFTYCPLLDLVKIVNEDPVAASTRYDKQGHMYFECQAMNYLCRGSELDDVNVKEFFEQYEFARMTNKRKEGCDQLPFMNWNGHFQHPSAQKYQNGNYKKMTEGVIERTKHTYIKVPQYEFPDCAKFKTHLITGNVGEICNEMETYAQIVLTLLYPHRSISDLKPTVPSRTAQYPYVTKLREVHLKEHTDQHFKMFTENNVLFLQNIQDCAYNSVRYKVDGDDLARETHAFNPCDPNGENESDSEDEEEAELVDNSIPYEDILKEMNDVDATDNDETHFGATMKDFSFAGVRNNGLMGCGYDDVTPEVPAPATAATEEAFVNYGDCASDGNPGRPPVHEERRNYGVKRVVEVLYTRTTARARKKVFKTDVEVHEANGSIRSIFEWQEAAKLDKIQQRAFQCIISAFLLTFFEVETATEVHSNTTYRERQKHRRTKAALLRLKGRNNRIREEDIQLICLLHGAGGSGKSTVINLVTAYAREYCELIGHRFTNRTIIVTAMSGVAATLLHGETAHGALHLNKSKIKQDHIDEWGDDARLLIIDEISFAGDKDFERMSKHLKKLMKKMDKKFGGLSIVFAGDFSQLEPVKRKALYDGKQCPEFHDNLNTFIELDGKHRFRDDPSWGNLLLRVQQGVPTVEDINLINNKCMVTEGHVPPNDVQVATYRNINRDAINSAVFEEYVERHGARDGSTYEGAVMIFMDNLEMQDSRGRYVSVTSNSVKRHFYSTCGEDTCRLPENVPGRCDPVLKLYPNCPLMLTQNKDVLCGKANGSRLYLKKINIKTGECPILIKMDTGVTIRGFFARSVKSLLVEHEAEDMTPQNFEIDCEDFTFGCKLTVFGEELHSAMRGRQFPVVSNTATTGHKLQGYTATSLLVNDWNYKVNWAYVVLSRVRTMAGLYIKVPLTTNLTKYAKKQEMFDMLTSFRNSFSVNEISEQHYEAMLKDDLE